MEYDLKKILPYAHPFLLIDKIVEFNKGKGLTAIKNVTANEWDVQGNETRLKIYPETLIIESAAQSALAFFSLENGETKQYGTFVLGQIKAEFLKEVKIGDQMLFKTGEYKILNDKGFMDVEANVGEEKIAQIRVYFGKIGKEVS